mmetsp:Transcript_7279/g.21484  ORF Transcript_7279/g.21484 Transcript_7279/m.21484 type:complete len:204 (-) Transcript_7279:221-832(-)
MQLRHAALLEHLLRHADDARAGRAAGRREQLRDEAATGALLEAGRQALLELAPEGLDGRELHAAGRRREQHLRREPEGQRLEQGAVAAALGLRARAHDVQRVQDRLRAQPRERAGDHRLAGRQQLRSGPLGRRLASADTGGAQRLERGWFGRRDSAPSSDDSEAEHGALVQWILRALAEDLQTVTLGVCAAITMQRTSPAGHF